MTAQMAMATMSSNWCCLHRSILGSSKAPKYSMMDAPFPFFITPHLTSQTLGLPSNDKPTIYNAIALGFLYKVASMPVTDLRDESYC